jgi:radical SAM protein with 4Fe4S-binding SPASM domain
MMDCVNFYELDMDDWGEILLKPLQGKRYPLAAEFEITERCNLGCVHCFINQPAGSHVQLERELGTEQIKEILDQIADAGCLHLLLTGGEPLLRRDFAEIFLHARHKGMLVMLFTNATLVTPAVIETLKQAPPILVEISLYGASRETYEAVTRVPGSWERFNHGLRLLLESGLPLALKSVILQKNKYELPMMQKFAADRGLRYRYDGSIFPRLDGSDAPYWDRLDIEEMLELDRSDPERMHAWVLNYELSQKLQLRSEKYVYSCGAGRRSFHIDSRGRLAMCMMARKPSYSILEMGFLKAWEELGKEVQLERTLAVPCLDCSASGICIQCPGWSQLVHGDNESVVGFICKLNKARERQIWYTRSVIEEDV